MSRVVHLPPEDASHSPVTIYVLPNDILADIVFDCVYNRRLEKDSTLDHFGACYPLVSIDSIVSVQYSYNVERLEKLLKFAYNGAKANTYLKDAYDA